MAAIQCNNCNKVLEEIGVPPDIQTLERVKQMYKGSFSISSEAVPEEVRKDPYVYRGFFCPACNKVFCPACCGMQGEVCPGCNEKKLMPAYRPLLESVVAGGGASPGRERGTATAEKESAGPPKAGPESGYCPHCGAFLLDEKGHVSIWLDISKKNPGAQGIFCVKCRQELDSEQLAALKQAHTSSPGGQRMEPPAENKPSATVSTGPTIPPAHAGELSDPLVGLLCYVTIIPAILFLVLEPYNRSVFIRFHAFQSIFFCIAMCVVSAVVMFVGVLPLLGLVLWPLFYLAMFVVWVLMMIKAFSGQMWKLPVIGDFAEKQANAR